MNNSQIKISFLLPTLGGGGAEKSIVKIANGLAKNKIFLVKIITGSTDGPTNKLIDKDIEVINFECKRVIKFIPKLISHLAKSKEDILFSSLSHTNIIAILAKIFAKSNTNIIVSERGSPSHSNILKSTRVKTTIIKHMMRFLYPKARLVHAVSLGVANDLSNYIKYPLHKINVTYNPVVTVEMLNKSKQLPLHPWCNDKSVPLITTVGRLGPEKGHDILIKSIALVKKETSCRLLILGEGPERIKLKKLIDELNLNDSIQLIGFQENPYSFVKSSRLFVLSSYTEGLPGSLIEAMACGTPVISTDCRYGPSEILENGKFGTLVDVGNEFSLAKSIISELKKEKESEIYQERSKVFSEEKIIKEYERIFSTIKNSPADMH